MVVLLLYEYRPKVSYIASDVIMRLLVVFFEENADHTDYSCYAIPSTPDELPVSVHVNILPGLH